MIAPRRSALNPLGLLNAAARVPTFRMGEANTCPSCGSTQWHVGRQVATCARCDMPLALTALMASPGSLLTLETEKEPA